MSLENSPSIPVYLNGQGAYFNSTVLHRILIDSKYFSILITTLNIKKKVIKIHKLYS